MNKELVIIGVLRKNIVTNRHIMPNELIGNAAQYECTLIFPNISNNNLKKSVT